YPAPKIMENLVRTTQALTASSAQCGLPLFSEISGKLAHIFDYAHKVGIGPESSGAIVDFALEAAALLDSDLMLLSTSGTEVVAEAVAAEPAESLPEDGEVPDEILEVFLPEAEEQLQAMTECLLALEANPSPEAVNRLFRAIHTVKGSAAQVGLQRIAHVAH